MESKLAPRKETNRAAEPVLTPELPQERRVIVDNVVFPAAIDRRGQTTANCPIMP